MHVGLTKSDPRGVQPTSVIWRLNVRLAGGFFLYGTITVLNLGLSSLEGSESAETNTKSMCNPP